MCSRLAVLLALAGLAFSQRKPVTLEALDRTHRDSESLPGAAIWAPDGKSFVFRQGRKIMHYDVAGKNAKELLSTEALENAAVKVPRAERNAWDNRGLREAPVSWSAGGKELLLAAGGDLFLYHLDSAKWDQLTKTPAAERDAKLSPDGARVSFRREWDLFTLEISTGKESRLTTGGSDTLRNGGLDWVYPEEIGLGTAHWWAPDSRSIAYLQFDISREPLYPHADLRGMRVIFEPERYPQAGENNPDVRFGVVAAGGGSTRWLDLGDTRHSFIVARAGWMPDATHVYVERPTRVQNRLELLSIDVATSAARAILTENDPYWINVHDEPRFFKNGKQFLWQSERDGFRHLYVYSIDGRDSRQITKGQWEVTALSGINESTGILYYVSSEASPLERHLYSIRVDGRDKKRLTETEGTHAISMAPTAEYFLDTHSSLKSPPRTTLRQSDGTELAVYREADNKPLEEYEILPTEIVTFKGADGTLFYARLIKPAGFEPRKKYPAVVDVYGGPHAQSVRNAWPGGVNIDQVLAHKGFVIWQMDNRGSAGRGHAFESAVYHKLGLQELADQKEGVRYLVSLGFVDPERIGVTGWSYGGFMTLNLLLNAPDTFRAGVAGAPVTDWHFYDTIYTERYMGLPGENAEGYKITALPQNAKNLKAKLLLVHCFEDDNVLFQNSFHMVEALEQAGKQFEFMLYPLQSHGVGGGPLRRHLNEALVAFFERNL